MIWRDNGRWKCPPNPPPQNLLICNLFSPPFSECLTSNTSDSESSSSESPCALLRLLSAWFCKMLIVGSEPATKWRLHVWVVVFATKRTESSEATERTIRPTRNQNMLARQQGVSGHLMTWFVFFHFIAEGQEDTILSYEPVIRQESEYFFLGCCWNGLTFVDCINDVTRDEQWVQFKSTSSLSWNAIFKSQLGCNPQLCFIAACR